MEGVGEEVLHFFATLSAMMLVIGVALYALHARRSRRGAAGDAVVEEARGDVRAARAAVEQERGGAASHAAEDGGGGSGGAAAGGDGRSAHHHRAAECPICLEEPPVACVETNCGHFFCGACLRQYYDAVSSRRGIACPCCRRIITLIAEYDADDQPAPASSDAEARAAFVRSYNSRHSTEGRSLWDRVLDLPMVLRHLPFRRIAVSMMGCRVVFAVCVSLLYLVLPVDLLPEAILGPIGLLDDLLVLVFCLLWVAELVRGVLVAVRRD